MSEPGQTDVWARAAEIVNARNLIQRLNDGDIAEVRRLLTARMCEDMAALDGLACSGDAEAGDVEDQVLFYLVYSANRHHERHDLGLSMASADKNERRVAGLLHDAAAWPGR